MLILSGSSLTYAQFQNALAELGTPSVIFYHPNGSDVSKCTVLFENPNLKLGVTFDTSTVSIATFTSAYTFAIQANID